MRVSYFPRFSGAISGEEEGFARVSFLKDPKYSKPVFPQPLPLARASVVPCPLDRVPVSRDL